MSEPIVRLTSKNSESEISDFLEFNASIFDEIKNASPELHKALNAVIENLIQDNSNEPIIIKQKTKKTPQISTNLDGDYSKTSTEQLEKDIEGIKEVIMLIDNPNDPLMIELESNADAMEEELYNRQTI